MPRDEGRPNDWRGAQQGDIVEDDDETSAETLALLNAHFPDLAPWQGNAYGGFSDNVSGTARRHGWTKYDQSVAFIAWGAVAGSARHNVGMGEEVGRRIVSKLGRGIVRAVELARGDYAAVGGARDWEARMLVENKGKRDALKSYPPHNGIRPVVLGARQIGGKKIVNEEEKG